MMRCLFCFLVLFALFFPLYSQEVFYDIGSDKVNFHILFPYDLFIFGRDQTTADYQASILYKDNKGKQVASSEHTMQIHKRDWLIGTALPITESVNLTSGSYSISVTLKNRTLGDKRSFNKQIYVGDSPTEISPLYVYAKREGILYHPVDLTLTDVESLIIKLSFCLQLDKLKLHVDNKHFDFEHPESIFELDLKQLIPEANEISTLKLTLFEKNIRYELEPFLYSAWISYDLRYSLKDQMAQLRFYANQSEWQTLRKVKKEDYAEAIADFWKSKDPSPGTIRNEAREQFYNRVLKADELFTIHKKLAGWSSDRGRIYIKFGKPDEITTDAFPIGRHPSISWIYYKLNLRFDFVDTKGFGSYPLWNKDEEYKDF